MERKEQRPFHPILDDGYTSTLILTSVELINCIRERGIGVVMSKMVIPVCGCGLAS